MESRRKSIIKTITWRVIATLATTLVALLLSRNIEMAINIGLIDMALKILLYYCHERWWAKIK